VIRDGRRFVRTGAAGRQAAQARFEEYLRSSKRTQALAGPTTGFIYFISADYPRFPIKIGFTQRNNLLRSKGLQTGNPYRLMVLATMPGGYSDERRLHRQFAAQRLEGEWFARSDDLMELIEERKAL
jgi:hypothetical protein